jgi:magnesium chelatase family protein
VSLINHFKGIETLRPVMALDSLQQAENMKDLNAPDLKHVKGQESAKRALIIAAAGGHNLLMSGPPGSGKSMLAACLPTIMPALTSREALETSIIHSISGHLPKEGLIRDRPFRNPHHSATLPALIGGGARAKPGELSLAHNGVLFLDELPEFARNTLESLRQPLETGEVVIARANHHLSYPAKAQVIAAMNPCRCGYLGDERRACSKAPKCGEDYQSKLSGPMLDRFDLHVAVPAVSIEDLSLPARGKSSAEARVDVERCRAVQHARNGGKENARLNSSEIERLLHLNAKARDFLDKAAMTQGLSARGYHRVLRCARTIMDFDHGPEALEIDVPALAEALSYRGV